MPAKTGILTLLTTVLFGMTLCHAYAGTFGQDTGELEERIRCFERLTNDVLSGRSDKTQLDPFLMDEEAIIYWMGQFEFTEEVLAQISREGFYNRLEGWARSAEFNFRQALEGADRIEVLESVFKHGDDPRLLVSRSANLLIELYRGGEVSGLLRVTLIDVKGQWKLIQVD